MNISEIWNMDLAICSWIMLSQLANMWALTKLQVRNSVSIDIIGSYGIIQDIFNNLKKRNSIYTQSE